MPTPQTADEVVVNAHEDLTPLEDAAWNFLCDVDVFFEFDASDEAMMHDADALRDALRARADITDLARTLVLGSKLYSGSHRSKSMDDTAEILEKLLPEPAPSMGM